MLEKPLLGYEDSHVGLGNVRMPCAFVVAGAKTSDAVAIANAVNVVHFMGRE